MDNFNHFEKIENKYLKNIELLTKKCNKKTC